MLWLITANYEQPIHTCEQYSVTGGRWSHKKQKKRTYAAPVPLPTMPLTNPRFEICNCRRTQVGDTGTSQHKQQRSPSTHYRTLIRTAFSGTVCTYKCIMFGETRYKPRQNSHQGQFQRKREKERRWEQSVEGIAATDKVCHTTAVGCVARCRCIDRSLQRSSLGSILYLGVSRTNRSTAVQQYTRRSHHMASTQIQHPTAGPSISPLLAILSRYCCTLSRSFLGLTTAVARLTR